MGKVILDMKEGPLSDAIRQALLDVDEDCEAVISGCSEETLALCCELRPYGLFLEVEDQHPRRLRDRLDICVQVKHRIPDCRILLVIDEHADKKLTDHVRLARRSGQIDRFIYGSLSTAYLTAAVEAL